MVPDVEFSGETFANVVLRDCAAVSGLHFDHCVFEGSSVHGPLYAPARLRVSNGLIADCRIGRSVSTGPIWLRDVTVRNLRTPPDWRILGLLLERVVLEGTFDSLMINTEANRLWPWPDGALGALQEEARAAYAGMEWAVDISRVESKELTLRNIPADLVRRDRTTQAVVRAGNLRGRDWRAIDYEGTWFSASVASVARGDSEDKVLVTPQRSRHAAAFLRVIGRLRDAGIADPD